jgi:hypothetical protein
LKLHYIEVDTEKKAIIEKAHKAPNGKVSYPDALKVIFEPHDSTSNIGTKA